MSETYCGKSCQNCTYRGEIGCRSCREDGSRECKLAQCCRGKGHETCDSCTFQSQCGIYRGRDGVPKFRLAKRESDREHQAFLKRRGALLSKWLWILFWLFIPANVASVMVEWIPGLETVGYILSFVCMVVYGVVLLKASSEVEGYRTAGILTLVSAALSLLTIAATQAHVSLTLVVSVASIVVSMFCCYYEFNAHADVLEGLDDELSDNWRKLWKWMLGTSIALVIGALLALVVIGALVVVVAVIIMLVISILKLVYHYRTARAFQDVAGS